MKNERKKWEDMKEDTPQEDTWVFLLMALVFAVSVVTFLLIGAM